MNTIVIHLTQCKLNVSLISGVLHWSGLLSEGWGPSECEGGVPYGPASVVHQETHGCHLGKPLQAGRRQGLVKTEGHSMYGMASGSENEYQLWIDSGKREESIALLGHENPYAIEMSQLGVTEFVPRGPSTHEMHNLHSPVLEHWNPPVGFRFVLKPRRPANGKQPNNSEQKREGRGRAFLNWLFGRQSNIAKENLPGKSASPKAGLLFGVSLQAACQDGKLPSAVLDMISFLSQEGELTEGIFRKSGSVKACRALKEKLISGAPVDLRQESVLVVASVLKDFLRNVQGSVFCTPIYETWLGIMDEDDEEEKIILAQSLLEMLPRANQLLLKHLFGMLNQIQKNSSLNLMTSYNLAVCTATSLMAPPPDARAGFDLELMRKVELVQFLIENTPQVFAKDFSPFW
ncbi:rho GTPase-activating protein 20-like [Thomomys bottae]